MSWQEELKIWVANRKFKLPEGKYPIILCEGPDGAGKSFIIDTLMNLIKHCFMLHTSAPIKKNYGDYFKNLLLKNIEFIKILEQPFIADRFHIGEAVYGSIYRNCLLDYKDIEEELLKLNAKQLFVKADANVLIERLKNRGDWYVKAEDVVLILNRYEEELEKSKLPTFIIDTTHNVTPENFENLLQFILK